MSRQKSERRWASFESILTLSVYQKFWLTTCSPNPIMLDNMKPDLPPESFAVLGQIFQEGAERKGWIARRGKNGQQWKIWEPFTGSKKVALQISSDIVAGRRKQMSALKIFEVLQHTCGDQPDLVAKAFEQVPELRVAVEKMREAEEKKKNNPPRQNLSTWLANYINPPYGEE